MGYYRRFICNSGKIARPLTDLLNKGNLKWNEDSNKAFIQLQQAVTTATVLSMLNFSKQFSIECDASEGNWSCSNKTESQLLISAKHWQIQVFLNLCMKRN